jgi:hypothetical protein
MDDTTLHGQLSTKIYKSRYYYTVNASIVVQTAETCGVVELKSELSLSEFLQQESNT